MDRWINGETDRRIVWDRWVSRVDPGRGLGGPGNAGRGRLSTSLVASRGAFGGVGSWAWLGGALHARKFQCAIPSQSFSFKRKRLVTSARESL